MKVCVICFALAASFSAAEVAGAQGIEASAIRGVVIDATGAVVPAAQVVLSGPMLIGGPRQTTSDRDGVYRFTLVPPGTYVMSANHPAGTSRLDDIRLAGQKTLRVDLALALPDIRETAAVSVVAPVIDVTSASTPVLLDRDLLTNLPTTRVVADLMNLTPGVNVSAGLGGTQLSNPIYIDGLNTSDPQQLSPGAAFSINWLDEVQVVGIGAPAAFGDFNGVVQTARLRSGGNRIGGLAEYRSTRPSWAGTNTSELAQSTQRTLSAQSQRVVDWHDINGQLGGPIVKDRIWYFGGFQHFTNNVRPALMNGDDSIDERDRRGLVKITSAPATRLRVEGFYEYERYSLLNDGLSPAIPVAATTTDTQPEHNWSVHATWILGDRTTFELRNAAFNSTYTFDPTAPATRSGPAAHFDIVTLVPSFNTTTYFDFESLRNTTTAALNRYIDGQFGRHHDLTAAVEFERAVSASTYGYPGGRQYFDRDGAPYLLYEASGEWHSAPTIHRFTAYAHDNWSVTEALTIQMGLRATVHDGLVYQGSAVSSQSLDPRIGVAWDLAADHKTVVRGHVGRYHDALLTAQFSAVDATQPPTVITSQFIDGQYVETNRSGSTSNYRIDPDLSAAYFDQATVGVERQVWPHWAVTAQFVGRRYHNLVGVLDTGTIYNPVARQDPGPDGQVGTNDDGEILTAYAIANPGHAFYYVTNPSSAYRRYSALQLIARKQYAQNWQLQASYAWSSTHGNIDDAARSNAGGPESGFNGIFANPNRAINADASSSFDFSHEVKVLGTWRFPRFGGVNLSGIYQFHTGQAWGRTAFLPGIQATYAVRMEPRGTRRTEALNNLDLRVEKTFDITLARRLGVFADVFNVGNQGAPDPSKIFAVEFRSGPNFGQPLNWLPPRTLRAGVRLMF